MTKLLLIGTPVTGETGTGAKKIQKNLTPFTTDRS